MPFSVNTKNVGFADDVEYFTGAFHLPLIKMETKLDRQAYQVAEKTLEAFNLQEWPVFLGCKVSENAPLISRLF